jgi:general secretion pathway protein G
MGMGHRMPIGNSLSDKRTCGARGPGPEGTPTALRPKAGQGTGCGPGGPPHRTRRGFTFVELMVVITIIVILITMAIPIYNNTIRRANESVLQNNLFTLRTVIDNYTGDKLKAPQSLQDLVTAGYLREIPYDPMTRSNQTWKIIMEDSSQSVSQSEPGIFDVRSGSDKTGTDGIPYAEK